MAHPPLIAQLLTISIISLQRQSYHNRGILDRTTWSDQYDFIVVGGGTAGSVVAGRLSQNPQVQVLLLEAGPPVQVSSDILPAVYTFNFDWGYKIAPQRLSSLGYHRRQFPYPRGKILGGSNAINFGAYSRGNRHDYDNWANNFGARGWSYEEVLPYFLRTENNTDPAVVAANPRFHSTSGPLEISTAPWVEPISKRWINAARQLGWPLNDFSVLDNQYGVNTLQTPQSLTNRTRQTTATAYIEVNIGRPNLHVLVNSHVTRILFDTQPYEQPRAIGVEFVRAGRTYSVRARREVILSAGTMNSPQLLMLSGIGPRWHLEQKSIPVTLDSPGVGSNLKDHLIIDLDYNVRNASDIVHLKGLLGNIFTIQNLYDFLVHAKGSLAGFPLAGTYYATNINGDRDWPDCISYIFINEYSSKLFLPVLDYALSDEWTRYFDQFDDRHFSSTFSVYRPRSTGTVRLASSDPFAAPIIDPNYYSDKRDLDAVVEAMSQGTQIAESPLFGPYVQYAPRYSVPGCQLCTDGRPLSRCRSYLRCVAQQYTFTSSHPSSTCRMGNATDPMAVVDERLRVRGVRNLRVIDASIMPEIPNGNLMAPTMMIGERGVDFIQKDHHLI